MCVKQYLLEVSSHLTVAVVCVNQSDISIAFFWHWPGVGSILLALARRQYSILLEPARRQYSNLWMVKRFHELSVFTQGGVG